MLGYAYDDKGKTIDNIEDVVEQNVNISEIIFSKTTDNGDRYDIIINKPKYKIIKQLCKDKDIYLLQKSCKEYYKYGFVDLSTYYKLCETKYEYLCYELFNGDIDKFLEKAKIILKEYDVDIC